jgi:P27 family predicted phage terminase small subunit
VAIECKVNSFSNWSGDMRGQKPVLKPYGDVIDLPVAKERVPDPPEDLSPEAKRVWNEVAPILVARNIYGEDTRHSLEAYCVHFAAFRIANKIINKEGVVVKNHINKQWGISVHAFQNFMRLATELGLTPISRGRVQKIQRAQGSSGSYLSGQKAKAAKAKASAEG